MKYLVVFALGVAAAVGASVILAKQQIDLINDLFPPADGTKTEKEIEEEVIEIVNAQNK